MKGRLILISHAVTPAIRQGALPADEPLDSLGIAEAVAARERLALSADAQALSSPAACALDTAQALGLTAQISPELADTDYGEWRGRALADIAVEAPAELTAWTRNPQALPRGGESFSQVLSRVSQWLDGLDRAANIVAVTHTPVIRAAVLYALNAPATSFNRIEIAPLSAIELRHSMRGWVWWPARS
jgi:broad specificity phosphatase PhoE